jgi:hypothetical protein
MVGRIGESGQRNTALLDPDFVYALAFCPHTGHGACQPVSGTSKTSPVNSLVS